jgi:hypothetical protein
MERMDAISSGNHHLSTMRDLNPRLVPSLVEVFEGDVDGISSILVLDGVAWSFDEEPQEVLGPMSREVDEGSC